MNPQKTIEQLFTECNEAVFDNTFELVYPKGKQQIPVLQRKLEDGSFWRVQALYKELSPFVLQIELWADIGIPKMIDIYHKIAEKKPAYFFYTSVLGNYMASIEFAISTGNNEANFEHKLYTLNKPQHIETTQKAINKSLKVVKKWFEKYSNIKAVDQLLNEAPTQPSAHVLMGTDRAYMGLIAAKLNNNPSYNELKRTYIATLTADTGEMSTEFTALINMLDSNNFKFV